MAFPIALTAATALFMQRSKVGTAMRAMANDRDITATLGVPVRRVEAAAWLGSGVLCGLSGLLLSNLVSLDIVTLTFIVIPALAAALIGRLRSLWLTLLGGFLIGIIQSSASAFSDIADYRNMTPFVLAIVPLLFLGRGQVEGRLS
jgi:branched-chain amino acid transport system permease protein